VVSFTFALGNVSVLDWSVEAGNVFFSCNAGISMTAGFFLTVLFLVSTADVCLPVGLAVYGFF
jgi:hypothetical protein